MSHGTGGHRPTGSRGVSAGRWVALGLTCVMALAACQEGARANPSPSPAARPASAPPSLSVNLVQTIYDGGFKSGWKDVGWAEREVKGPGPARVMMAELGSWAMERPEGVKGTFGGLALRYRAPAGYGEFLEVRLDSQDSTTFPRVTVAARHAVAQEGEWVQLLLPMGELNPEQRSFERIVLRASKRVGREWVELDHIGLTRPGAQVASAGRSTSLALVEVAYDGGLKPGWEASGWTERTVGKGPAQVMMAELGGWSLQHKENLLGTFGGLALRYRAPSGYGDFLEVRLDTEDANVFPRVRVGAQHQVNRQEDWVQVLVPLAELNPEMKPFSRIVMRAYKKVGTDWVEMDRIGLTGTDAAGVGALSAGGGRVAVGPPKAASLSVLCTEPTHAISPLIYGIAFNALRESKDEHLWEMGATVRRWGGNPTTRYNWRINAWNTANDWYFRNTAPGDEPKFTYEEFLLSNRAHGVQSALTLPLIGWVAKDTSSVSFPTSKFKSQEKVAPEMPEAGNGKSPSGALLPPLPPEQTSVAAPPEFIAEWVRTMRQKDQGRGRSVQMYFLDNEPMLWNSTHRDVHPAPTTYDELLERTLSYGTAVRQADPEAVIAGPAEWGWTAYFRSAADVDKSRPADADRKAHGNVPLLPWYLRKLRDHQKKTGVRILDVLDVHFYPQGTGIGLEEGGETDEDTSARRIRSTRALWDDHYKDESWIGEPVRLIPRLKKMVAENYPGLGLALGEYNFGATRHMSGGLAQAEALGRFAEGNLTAAYHFTYPPERSPTWWAFRAYRDFDGKGGRFQDLYVPTRAGEGTSLFASRSVDGQRVVAIALNLAPETARAARVELKGCGALRDARVLTYTGDPNGFAEQQEMAPKTDAVEALLPPYSITVLDLTLAPSRGPRPSP
ncbi:glycoside hydrolase family 44 protein [Stigmatella aurantiaca]|uniref:Glycosyl hydrolase n=2 Tax=Stigmatella aurantiaca (strain DW4/3-1) TaxID=378806 RepID=E3FNF9_STIAD|nr:glycoside hydrolase family 44 protein [Stigmatella aurantiaca]ADO75632.1 glycosyl hydrolase [Stigmatella aurantiaca DW4/3-1]